MEAPPPFHLDPPWVSLIPAAPPQQSLENSQLLPQAWAVLRVHESTGKSWVQILARPLFAGQVSSSCEVSSPLLRKAVPVLATVEGPDERSPERDLVSCEVRVANSLSSSYYYYYSWRCCYYCYYYCSMLVTIRGGCTQEGQREARIASPSPLLPGSSGPTCAPLAPTPRSQPSPAPPPPHRAPGRFSERARPLPAAGRGRSLRTVYKGSVARRTWPSAGAEPGAGTTLCA